MHFSSSSATPRTALNLRQPSKVGLRMHLMGLLAVSRSRKALRDLTDAQLDDLGLTADEALREAKRPFWDVPQHWLR